MSALGAGGGGVPGGVTLGQLRGGHVSPHVVRNSSADDSWVVRVQCGPAGSSPRSTLERQNSSASMASSSGSSGRWQDEPSHAELLAKFERHGTAAGGTQDVSRSGLGRRVERAARAAIDALRAPKGGTTAFGLVWFLCCGLLNAVALNSALAPGPIASSSPSASGARERVHTPLAQLVESILVALQAVLLLCFFLRFSGKSGRWAVYRRFLLLQGLLWLLRPVTTLSPGLSRHSRLILSSELSMVNGPAAHWIAKIHGWSTRPFTGHADDFILLGMLWHRFSEGGLSKALMWVFVLAGPAGLLWSRVDHEVDVYMGVLLGMLVSKVYDAYAERTAWSLQTEGRAAKNRGWLKPFVCWYEDISAPAMGPPPKKYRIIPFGGSARMADARLGCMSPTSPC